VQGTLKADGTLVVNQKLHLAPGPVLVTVQPMTPRQRGLADVIDEIRQGQQEPAPVFLPHGGSLTTNRRAMP